MFHVHVACVCSAGIPITIKGDGIPHPLAKSEKSGKYNVRFGFGVPFQGSEMTIIDTDYKEYAVIYSCTSSIIQGLYHTGKLYHHNQSSGLC